jgi:hypothetical protein
MSSRDGCRESSALLKPKASLFYDISDDLASMSIISPCRFTAWPCSLVELFAFLDAVVQGQADGSF